MKIRKSETKVNIDFNGDDYSATVSFKHWKENYGADADGNRGIMRDEYEIDDITDFKKNGKPIAESEVPQEVMDKFEDAEPE